MSGSADMRAALVSLLLGLAVALPAVAANNDSAQTLKDLQKREVQIRRDEPSDVNAGKAMDNYRRFLELQKTDPALRAEAMRRLGDLSLESGELERMAAEVTRVDMGGAEAIRLYTLLLQAYPDYPRNDQVLYQLARAYETTGQPEMALEKLDEIVRRYPSTREIAEVHFRRGELLFSAKRYHDAELAYAEVTSRGPGGFYQQSLYKQGWSLFKQSMYDESLPVFAKLLDMKLLDPATPGKFRQLDAMGRADREMTEDTLRVMSVTFSYLDGVEPLDRFVNQIGSPAYTPLLYSWLGDLYVDKQRFQDGATAYRAFVARDPNNEFSPGLSSQAIEAYRKGGFAQLVLDGKREYVERYNLGTTFWQGRERANYPQIVAEIKTHLTDLAAYYHATAQKSKKPEDYAEAAHWYRLQLQSFPDDPEAAQVNYRLADVLFEGGQFAAAVDEYERTAYTYPPGPDSAKAAYAALSAYQKHEALLPVAERPAWKMRSTESGVRFAQAFPEHPDSAGVLTRATQDLYTARNLPRAIEVGNILLARSPPADAAQRRIGYSVIGQSQFDLGQYGAAEAAWVQARELSTGNPAQQKELSDQLSVAVYRQAEAKRAAGDAAGAVDDFLRVATVAPGTAVVETARYDAAAELIKLEQWPRAIEVLEAYRRDYPASKLQGDVTQKLAVAYLKAGQSGAAAVEFERIADNKAQPPEVRLEALTIASDQYAASGNTAKTVALMERLVAEFPAPVAERIETRQKLADYAARDNNLQRERYWQAEIVKADASAGPARTDRTKYLAAKSSLALAAPARDTFRGLQLVAPLSRSLAAKRRALESALTGYRSAAAYNVAEVTTVANYEIAELYRQLATDLLASERPKNLSSDELEQYDLLLEEQATPFEEEAIKLHEANTVHARDGIYDDGVKSSYVALAKLLPAKYGKTEMVGSWTRSLVLAETPVPAPPPPADPVTATAAPVTAPAPSVPAAPNPRLVSQFERAVNQVESGQAVEAELEFKQLMEAAPDQAGAAYNLGVQLRAAGRLEEAEQAFATAASRAPRSAPALTELGLTQRQRGNFTAAVDSYTRALAVDPDHAPAHRNLGVVQDVYLGDPGAAIESFERYKALTGEDRPVTSWIADVRQRSGRAGTATPVAPPAAVEANQ